MFCTCTNQPEAQTGYALSGAHHQISGEGGGGGQFFCAGFSFWWALAFGAASFFLANAGIFLSGRILHDFLFLAY